MKNKIRMFLHKHGFHFWVYRNPANRTCEICGKHQEQYVMAYEDTNWMSSRYSWWEDMNFEDEK